MSRNGQTINVVFHIPNESALQNLEESTNDLYVHIVSKRLNNSDLTISEKKNVITRLMKTFEKASE